MTKKTISYIRIMRSNQCCVSCSIHIDRAFRFLERDQGLQNGCVMRLVCWWAFGCSSPCAFSLHRWLASWSQHRERESRVSVFPCQYRAYPQQVLCSAFSWLQVSMGAARPQNRTARAKLAWPDGRAGGGGRKSQRLRKRTRSSLAIG